MPEVYEMGELGARFKVPGARFWGLGNRLWGFRGGAPRRGGRTQRKCGRGAGAPLALFTYLGKAMLSGLNTSSNFSAVRNPRLTQASFKEIFSSKALCAVLAAFS